LALYEGLRQRQIFPQVHYIPVHTQPWYQNLGFRPGDFPESENYYAGTLSLPMYYGLTDADQDRVVAALTEILES
jgi:dTDP-4-amino-4,6-dideoxygalactose transaminase